MSLQRCQKLTAEGAAAVFSGSAKVQLLLGSRLGKEQRGRLANMQLHLVKESRGLVRRVHSQSNSCDGARRLSGREVSSACRCAGNACWCPGAGTVFFCVSMCFDHSAGAGSEAARGCCRCGSDPRCPCRKWAGAKHCEADTRSFIFQVPWRRSKPFVLPRGSFGLPETEASHLPLFSL